MPPWYPLVRAARYAGVGLWELEERSVYYRNVYLAAERAEHEAEAMKQQRQQRLQRRGA